MELHPLIYRSVLAALPVATEEVASGDKMAREKFSLGRSAAKVGDGWASKGRSDNVKGVGGGGDDGTVSQRGAERGREKKRRGFLARGQKKFKKTTTATKAEGEKQKSYKLSPQQPSIRHCTTYSTAQNPGPQQPSPPPKKNLLSFFRFFPLPLFAAAKLLWEFSFSYPQKARLFWFLALENSFVPSSFSASIGSVGGRNPSFLSAPAIFKNVGLWSRLFFARFRIGKRREATVRQAASNYSN